MKIRLLLSAVAASLFPLFAFAQETPSTADLSQFKTGDELWAYFEKQMENQPTDVSGALPYFTNARQIMENFVQRFPKSPRFWEAKMLEARFSLMAAQFGGPADTDKVEASLVEIGAAADAPEDVRKGARLLLLSLAARNEPAKLETTLDAFEKDYPNDALPGQLALIFAKKLQSSNPAKAQKLLEAAAQSTNEQAAMLAKSALARQGILNKPLDIKFTDLDGKQIDLAKMKGKVVLVDFWATWCGPCMQEVPHIVAAYKKYHERGFEIIGISLDEEKDAVLATTKREGMTWPQYFDGKGWENSISSSYGIRSIPEMWLVDKKGNLVDTDAGDDLEEKIKKLLE